MTPELTDKQIIIGSINGILHLWDVESEKLLLWKSKKVPDYCNFSEGEIIHTDMTKRIIFVSLDENELHIEYDGFSSLVDSHFAGIRHKQPENDPH